MGINSPFDFYIITIEGRDAQDNAMFYPPKETFDPLNSHGNEQNACVIH